jgi:hypothetical protein
MPLGDAYCATDVYVPGLPFRDDCWLAHLAKPDTGSMHMPLLLVTQTLFRDYDKSNVVSAHHDAAKPSPELVKDFRRLRAIAAATRARFPARLRQHLDHEYNAVK